MLHNKFLEKSYTHIAKIRESIKKKTNKKTPPKLLNYQISETIWTKPPPKNIFIPIFRIGCAIQVHTGIEQGRR